MLALIDETIIEVERGHIYVIASALILDAESVDHDACNALREMASTVIGERKRPFHWKSEGVTKKQHMIESLAVADVFVVAAISSPGERYHQRAKRSECLVAVCQQLSSEGVSLLVIESRQSQDADDVSTLSLAKKEGRLPPDFPEPLFMGKEERLLWLPDAVAGAIREGETGICTTWVETLTDGGVILDIMRL